jgi:hypothetical protein
MGRNLLFRFPLQRGFKVWEIPHLELDLWREVRQFTGCIGIAGGDAKTGNSGVVIHRYDFTSPPFHIGFLALINVLSSQPSHGGATLVQLGGIDDGAGGLVPPALVSERNNASSKILRTEPGDALPVEQECLFVFR